MTDTIQSLVTELESKGYGADRPVSETTLRSDYQLPRWVAITPAFVELLNEHLSTITVGPEVPDPRQNESGQSASGSSSQGDDFDIYDLFTGALGSLLSNDKKS